MILNHLISSDFNVFVTTLLFYDTIGFKCIIIIYLFLLWSSTLIIFHTNIIKDVSKLLSCNENITNITIVVLLI